MSIEVLRGRIGTWVNWGPLTVGYYRRGDPRYRPATLSISVYGCGAQFRISGDSQTNSLIMLWSPRWHWLSSYQWQKIRGWWHRHGVG